MENQIGGNVDGNEFYLFHGTKRDVQQYITSSGLDPRVARPGLFGLGLYFGENASKSDEYSSVGQCVVVVCRVTLGQAWLRTSQQQAPLLPATTVPFTQLSRPPWLSQ